MGDAARGADARRDRAARRRATWPAGEVVETGTPKPPLHADVSAETRLARLAALSERAWVLAGREVRRLPRSDWPGEIYEIRHVGPRPSS